MSSAAVVRAHFRKFRRIKAHQSPYVHKDPARGESSGANELSGFRKPQTLQNTERDHIARVVYVANSKFRFIMNLRARRFTE